MNKSDKKTIKCELCGKEVDTSKERIFRVKEDENSKAIKICEEDWKKNSEQYLKNPNSIIYSLYTGDDENFGLVIIKTICLVCKKNFLVKETENQNNDLCSKCNLTENKKPETAKPNKNPIETNQTNTTNHKNPKEINPGIIALIIIVIASILGVMVYYFWNKRKKDR